MSNYCQCGGYLGSGGVDMYAGRWCRCANPIAISDMSVAGTHIAIANRDNDYIIQKLTEERDAYREALETYDHIDRVIYGKKDGLATFTLEKYKDN